MSFPQKTLLIQVNQLQLKGHQSYWQTISKSQRHHLNISFRISFLIMKDIKH